MLAVLMLASPLHFRLAARWFICCGCCGLPLVAALIAVLLILLMKKK